ncbi:MAG: hypothetical protein ACK2U9_11330, partial [Anaerolineae bacterium]
AARAVGLAMLLTPLAVVLDEYVLDLPAWFPWLPGVISNGVLPAAVIGIGLWLAAHALRRRAGATRNEVVLSAFVFLAVAFVVLTIVGVWFRGPGMALTWPWQVHGHEDRMSHCQDPFDIGSNPGASMGTAPAPPNPWTQRTLFVPSALHCGQRLFQAE